MCTSKYVLNQVWRGWTIVFCDLLVKANNQNQGSNPRFAYEQIFILENCFVGIELLNYYVVACNIVFSKLKYVVLNCPEINIVCWK